MAAADALKRRLRRAARAALRPRQTLAAERARRSLVSGFLHDRGALAAYEREVRESGLVEHLRDKAAEWRTTVSAANVELPLYTMGTITYREGMHLYAVLRTLRPSVAVETGVANGFSTAFSLLALERNGEGELHSIDLPRVVGQEYEAGTFYEGKGRAGLPEGERPGWLIPDSLRERWTLILGRSQEELPPLLARLGTIDFFMHDSEHSFECMSFEYGQAWPALREGGVLVSDDVNSTDAFPRFANEVGRTPIPLGTGIAFLVK
jgi:predicted O-methyltransferase YrrM